MSALLGIQMWMPQADVRAIEAVVCPIPAFHTYATAGSWSMDHKNRKPAPAWPTSVSAP